MGGSLLTRRGAKGASGALLLLCLLAPAVALAFRPQAEEFSHLERNGSLQRIPEDGGQRIQQMLLPLALDKEVIPGLVLDGISLDRYWVELILKSTASQGSIFLMSHEASGPFLAETPSFRVAVDGTLPGEALSKVVAVLQKNDRQDFWPRQANELAVGTGESEQDDQFNVGPNAMRLADVSHLWGDLLVSLGLLLTLFALSGFWRAFRQIRAWEWLVGAGVLATALAWRWAYSVQGEPLPELTWESTFVMAPDSKLWLLYTLSRFVDVTPGLLSSINIWCGASTALAVWLGVRLALPSRGLWPALMAALFVACWPTHIALSCTPSVFVLLGFCMSIWLLGLLSFVRSESLWVHVWALVPAAVALFLRPEAALLMLPFFPTVFLLTERSMWARARFWLPQVLFLLILVARGATWGQVELGRDPFLYGSVDVQAWTGLLGKWILSYTVMPFPALLLWAASIAARPWKGEYRWSYFACAFAFVAAWAIYYHGFGAVAPWALRASLGFLVPLVGFAALGCMFMERTLGRWANWVLGGACAVMVVAPLWHWSLLREQAGAHLVLDFLL